MFAFLAGVAEWVIGLIWNRRVTLGEKAGQAEQKVTDDEELISRLEAEKDAAASRPVASDDLRDGKF